MENILEVFVNKDSWESEIIFQEQEDGIVLTVVGEEFMLTKDQVHDIRRFLNTLPI